ncbi:MAG TPA: EipA family protein [Sphingobium sp.]|nr:EipA family protein [Sphingobium sp.]
MRLGLAAVAATGLAAAPALAQIGTIDPNTQIDADLVPGAPASADAVTGAPAIESPLDAPSAPVEASTATAASSAAPVTTTADGGTTYKQDDLIGAAEGVFGKGAEGLAGIIEKVLKDQGEPIAYIAGREASGAIGVGLRYGSGTLFHKIEGQRNVYWTGPSLGFDLGGNAANTFVLVYNLYDTQDLYKRYPAGEGAAYLVGGFNASYLRWKNVVLIPIRLGVGYRLGANVGYMKFSEKRTWLPF